VIVNDPKILSEVTDAFSRYEAALTANDITMLDAFFWNSPLTLRYGIGERLYGFSAIAAFRQARAGGSPQRRLVSTVITTYGADFATANTEFHRDGEARIGRQSQSWVRIEGRWKIVAAHVSLEAERS
jgi:hypothetical protein